MGLDNHIEYAMKELLKNPILLVLSEIKIASILKQSSFSKLTYRTLSLFSVYEDLFYFKRKSSIIEVYKT